MSMKNEYHLRTVADTAAKACYICYKPTPKVLITPDNKDFFYVCASHLTDKSFCNPMVDVEAKKKEELEKEIAKVTTEYEEKQRRKQEKAKKDDKDKDKEKEKKDAKSKDDDLEKEKDDKIKNLKAAQTPTKPEDEYRIFTLHANFFKMRVDRIRNIQRAQKERERLKDPVFFPAAPKGDL